MTVNYSGRVGIYLHLCRVHILVGNLVMLCYAEWSWFRVDRLCYAVPWMSSNCY